MGDIQSAVSFMIDVANDNSHGYDQANRYGPDYDCSSLVSTALYQAGFDVSPYSWTGNLYEQLKTCGFREIPANATWLAGDIHLTPGKHVAMSVNPHEIAHASINELGKITDGETGDQTGKEICIRNFYTPSYGWKYHLRCSFDHYEDTLKPINIVALEVIKGLWGNGDERRQALHSAGYNAAEVQEVVNLIVNYGGAIDIYDGIADEVINGKWGNGKERKDLLTEAGYDYYRVQRLVNQKLGGS